MVETRTCTAPHADVVDPGPVLQHCGNLQMHSEDYDREQDAAHLSDVSHQDLHVHTRSAFAARDTHSGVLQRCCGLHNTCATKAEPTPEQP